MIRLISLESAMQMEATCRSVLWFRCVENFASFSESKVLSFINQQECGAVSKIGPAHEAM